MALVRFSLRVTMSSQKIETPPQQSCLLRSALLDHRQKRVGYQLSWDHPPYGDHPGDLTKLIDLLEQQPPAPSCQYFLNAGTAPLSATVGQRQAPKGAVLILRPEHLATEGAARAASLHGRGFSLAMRGADLAWVEAHTAILKNLSWLMLPPEHAEMAAIIRAGRLAQPALGVLVDECPSWDVLKACALEGRSAFFPKLSLAARAPAPAQPMHPQNLLILKLMQMVQENASVRQLEDALKRDAVLSYKLFSFLNSASFGLEVEIQSLRHAVAMMGYAPLFRWLSLLLASSQTASSSPAVQEAAIIRGRFSELLGEGLLPPSQVADLFVVGMFSLLDQTLGIPLLDILEKISLPTAMTEALTSRQGVYGPILALAEACEHAGMGSADCTDALLLTPEQVSKAHMAAIAWATSVTL